MGIITQNSSPHHSSPHRRRSSASEEELTLILIKAGASAARERARLLRGGARMKIKDIMHQGAVSVGPDTSIALIARQMRDQDIGAMPIVEKGKVIGIVTDRDVTVRGVADGQDLRRMAARQVMSRNVVCCKSGETVEHALKAMEEARVRRMPVTDGGDQLVGMISLGDIVAAHRPDLTAEVVHAVAAHHS
jgi:CBS domain-containing protein